MKTKMNKQLILSFIGLSIVLLSYYFIFLKFSNETELLDNDSHQIELKITEYEKLEEKSSFYLSEIDRMQSEMDTLLKEFPDNMKLENCIMMSQNMEDTIDSLEISSISLGDLEGLNESDSNNDGTSNTNGVNNANTNATTSGTTNTTAGTSNTTTSTTTADAAAGTSNTTASTTTTNAATGTTTSGTTNSTAGTLNTTASTSTAGTSNTTTVTSQSTASSENKATYLILYKKPLNITYKVNYNGLKEMINFIYKNKKRMTIDTISVFSDPATGDLSGNATINIFTINETITNNKALDIPSISQGIDNIFGSSTPQKDDTEK